MSHPLASAVEMFEGESERLLWLPAITLGYVFTQSGAPVHFILAVVGIGGARLFGDIINSELVEQTPDGPKFRDDTFELLRSSYPLGKSWLFAIVGLGYVASALVAVYGLIQFFNHSNLIIVALAATWAGAGLVVLLNF